MRALDGTSSHASSLVMRLVYWTASYAGTWTRAASLTGVLSAVTFSVFHLRFVVHLILHMLPSVMAHIFLGSFPHMMHAHFRFMLLIAGIFAMLV